VAFECLLHETMETESRYVFFGEVKWMAARPGLIDTELWRVNLQQYAPVARFGASFYIHTHERFALAEASGATASTATSIDRM
jgi:flavin reductase (DIM6/NTAB) family NADH-FMN oxidoreductase RutF